MYLKSLTLKGFKSFADRTVLQFEPNLAAIVGPNGSGKSNISDAVLWVLGERNAKNLRGQFMEDVIFAGSSVRKPVSVAEVELCLDNSDGTLPIDYSEVSIGRRMYRSGESEYLINGTIVRRMDVLDILHDSGLGTGTNSIISQGNLDSVLSSKPEDRRALIEEAAGVLKHKERKARAERKLERMDINVTRIQDIVIEVERQLGPLKRKAKRAQTHGELSQELQQLKTALAVDDLRQLQKQWELLKVDEEQLNQTVLQQNEHIQEKETALVQLQQAIQAQASDERDFSAKQRQMQAISERFKSTLLLLQEKKRHAQQDLQTMAIALEEAEADQNSIRETLTRAQANKDVTAEQKQSTETVLAQLEQEHKSLQSERNELRKKVDTNTTEQRTITHRIETLQAQRDALVNDVSVQQARAQVLASSVEQARERLEEAKTQEEATQKATQTWEDRTAGLAREEQEAKASLEKVTRDRDDARKALDAARDTYAHANAEHVALEELEKNLELSNDALRKVLDNHDLNKQLTPLVSQLHIDPKWETAVEVYLADKVHGVVAESNKTIATCIDDLLDSQSSGTVHFISEQSVAAYLAHQDQSLQNRNATVLADKGYEPLLRYCNQGDAAQSLSQDLFDQVYCADSLQAALEGPSFAIIPSTFITADGIMVNSSGFVTYAAPSDEQKNTSLIRIHRQVEEAKIKETAARAALDQVQSELEQLEATLQEIQIASLQISQNYAQAKGQLEAARSELVRVQQAAKQQQDLLQQYLKEQEENAGFLNNALPTIDGLEQELSTQQVALAAKKEEIASLESALQPIQKEIIERSRKISDTRLELARIDERFAYEQRLVQSQERELQNTFKKRSDAQNRIATAQTVVDRIDPFMALIDSFADKSALRAQALEAQLSSQALEARRLNDQLTAENEMLATLRTNLQAITQQHSDIKVQQGKLEVQVESAISVITDDCGLALETAMQLDPLDEREDTEELAGRIERRIKAMGVISPDAVAEYEQVNERYEYLTTQLRDLKAARRALTTIVDIIDERMKLDFITTFEQVNENFKEIYGVLFPGGSAYLTLDDPEHPDTAGVEVHAHPVGKRLRKMSLLSGGEKSMTALALLFAVYRIRMTPFYILDEVEAALDDTNLRRLLSYLDTLRKKTQFIMITHQRRTMETADILYGVSMQSDGITKVISQKVTA